MSESLYTTNDVKKVREKLLEEQDGKDLATGLEIPKGQAVLDHNHSTQYVRGVLHRQTNAVLGKIENLWTRYLGWWYNGTLPEFLRKLADYLERPDNQHYVHPGWIKRVSIDFGKLGAYAQTCVLKEMSVDANPKNATERRKLFQKTIVKNKLKYEFVKGLLDEDYYRGK